MSVKIRAWAFGSLIESTPLTVLLSAVSGPRDCALAFLLLKAIDQAPWSENNPSPSRGLQAFHRDRAHLESIKLLIRPFARHASSNCSDERVEHKRGLTLKHPDSTRQGVFLSRHRELSTGHCGLVYSHLEGAPRTQLPRFITFRTPRVDGLSVSPPHLPRLLLLLRIRPSASFSGTSVLACICVFLVGNSLSAELSKMSSPLSSKASSLSQYVPRHPALSPPATRPRYTHGTRPS